MSCGGLQTSTRGDYLGGLSYCHYYEFREEKLLIVLQLCALISRINHN